VLDAVANPLAVTSGADPELAESIKQLAWAFRAITFRAVRPEDYAEIAERCLSFSEPAPVFAGLAVGSAHSSPPIRLVHFSSPVQRPN
jgi:hypothetical protein